MIYWGHVTNKVRYKVPTIEKGVMIKDGKPIEIYTNKDKFNFVILVEEHLIFVINNKEYNKMGRRLSFDKEVEPIIRKFGHNLA